MRLSIIVFLYVLSCYSFAAVQQTVVTKVNNVEQYTNYGGGDVTFKVDDPPGGCFAFWLSPDDNGYWSSFAVLLSAFHKQSSVAVLYYDDKMWTGSNANHCKVYLIGLRR